MNKKVLFSLEIKLLWLLKIVFILTLLTLKAEKVKSFTFYNEMRFQNQPDLSVYGFKEIRVVYVNEMWPPKSSKEEPDTDYISKRIIDKYIAGEILCIDIEHWPLDIRTNKDSEVNKSINKYIKVINTFKKNLTDSYFGVYSMFPIRDYRTPTTEKGVNEWRLANKKLSIISKNVDYIFPSLYTFYKDKEGWKKYALENINEAKKYGKPVIPFIWPQYHPSNRLRKLDFIDADFWKMQLDFIYEHAEGLVIWSPRGEFRSDWDENAAWWKITKEFLEDKKNEY